MRTILSSSVAAPLRTLRSSGIITRTAPINRAPPVRRLSYPGPNPSAGGVTPMMSEWPYGTFFVGCTTGYFIAMYMERTYNKDKMVTAEDRKKVLPSAK